MDNVDDDKRETITMYVTGNGSDSAAVQEVLNQLAFFDDETLRAAEGEIEVILEMLEDQLGWNDPINEEIVGDEGEAESEPVDEELSQDELLHEALETIMELLSEIRLYNFAQRLDPISSTFLSKQLGI